MDTIDLYPTITSHETTTGNTVDIKLTMVGLVDTYLQERTNLTATQRGQLARLRASIITGLTNF